MGKTAKITLFGFARLVFLPYDIFTLRSVLNILARHPVDFAVFCVVGIVLITSQILKLSTKGYGTLKTMKSDTYNAKLSNSRYKPFVEIMDDSGKRIRIGAKFIDKGQRLTDGF